MSLESGHVFLDPVLQANHEDGESYRICVNHVTTSKH
jgi:hypothetical protein